MRGRKEKNAGGSMSRRLLAVLLSLVCLLFCATMVYVLEERMSAQIENAGMQLTGHTNTRNTAQVFMNGHWYAERNTDALLIIGVDQYGELSAMDSSHGGRQADFLVLFLCDTDTGRSTAIHINRDTMTDVMTYGVTGEPTGSRWTQLAVAYNYGSTNVVSAVERLMYGIEIDHYITVSMDAVPVMNDWAGGVSIEVLDDFTDLDLALMQGRILRLSGQQALTYVRTRKGLDDSSNLRRMERQRQYASEWVKSAQSKLSDGQAVTELVLRLDGLYQSDCTVEQLAAYAKQLNMVPFMPVYEIEGQVVRGESYMEYHADEDALQKLVLELFWAPVY